MENLYFLSYLNFERSNQFTPEINICHVVINRTNVLILLITNPSTDEVVEERSKYKAIAEEVDQTFADLSGY